MVLAAVSRRHALDRMQGKGILSPSAVLDVINNLTKIIPGTNGITIYIKDNLKVVVNTRGGYSNGNASNRVKIMEIFETSGKYIEFKIKERSNPQAIDLYDANWLDATVEVKAPGLHVFYSLSILANEVVGFYAGLESLRNGNKSSVEFSTIEEQLYLKGELQPSGNIIWKIISKFDDNSVEFSLITDNFSLEKIILDIKQMINDFPVIEQFFKSNE
jgi:hypothetical protein